MLKESHIGKSEGGDPSPKLKTKGSSGKMPGNLDSSCTRPPIGGFPGGVLALNQTQAMQSMHLPAFVSTHICKLYLKFTSKLINFLASRADLLCKGCENPGASGKLFIFSRVGILALTNEVTMDHYTH